eukprot:306806-Hanusia_phi.AAC.1
MASRIHHLRPLQSVLTLFQALHISSVELEEFPPFVAGSSSSSSSSRRDDGRGGNGGVERIKEERGSSMIYVTSWARG